MKNEYYGIGSGVAMAISDGNYKYIQSLGGQLCMKLKVSGYLK